LGGRSATMDSFDLCHLADRPEFIASFVPLLILQWHEPMTPQQIAARTQRLEAHCNRGRLPLALVAYDNDGPIGLVALREHDLDEHPELGPWLAGLFVRTERRSQGIGAVLCEAVELEARTLGSDELYAFSLDRAAFYQRLGFTPHLRASWQGQGGDILRKDLALLTSKTPGA
jgi:predicted N-acetyltransferase YhbS